MSGYGPFSYFYDRLTLNISYKDRAEYFDRLIKLHGGRKNLLLDLACGTGSLSEEFASGLPIQYLCQDMTELDMFGTIDVTICALDSLNHLSSKEDMQKAINKVSLFCEPGGLFIFDVNTPYKHKNILAENTYVYDLDDVYCVWQNSFAGSPDSRVNITLDIFERDDNGRFTRYGEEFSEIAFEKSVMEEMIKASGMTVEAVYDYDTLDPARTDSEKLVFVAKKPLV